MKYAKLLLVALLALSGPADASLRGVKSGGSSSFSGGVVTAPITVPATANCAAPSYSFTGDTDNGITSIVADTVAVCNAGAQTCSFTSTGANACALGATTAASVAATTLSASSTISGNGFINYLASPPAIGGITPAAGAFTTLSASSTVSGTGFSTYLASPPAIGGTAPAAGTFTTVTAADTGSFRFTTDTFIKRYGAGQFSFTKDGTGATTNAGWILGYSGTSGAASLWPSVVTPSDSTRVLWSNASALVLGNTATHSLYIDGSALVVRVGSGSPTKVTQSGTAGEGPAITAGTATTDVAALSVTRTNNNAAVATGVKFTFTDTTSAAGFLPFQVLGTSSGAANLLSLSKAGKMVVGYDGSDAGSGSYVSIIASAPNNYLELQTGSKRLALTDNAGVGLISGASVSWGSHATTPPYQAGASGDSGLSRVSAGVIGVGTGAAGSVAGTIAATNYRVAAKAMVLGAAPTIASGGCTAPAVTSNNGTAAFLLTLGASCTGVKTIVLTLPAASTYWHCQATNNTSSAAQDTNVVVSLSTSTTSVTLTNYARTTGLQQDYTASDTVLVSCLGG